MIEWTGQYALYKYFLLPGMPQVAYQIMITDSGQANDHPLDQGGFCR